MSSVRKLNKKEKYLIIDLCCKGYSRTSIAKKLKMKNLTLEKICQQENISLPKKGSHFNIRENTKGILKCKNKNIIFNNAYELYLLLKINRIQSIIDICKHEENNVTIYFLIWFKVKDDIKCKMIENLPKIKPTINMIQYEVEKGNIYFINKYLNNKFNISYII